VESTIQSEVEENTPSLAVTTNANATLNGTASSFLVQQQEPLANRIAKHYPIANAMIAMFDIFGLIIFFSGFLYFVR
jgi:hypothetical protein